MGDEQKDFDQVIKEKEKRKKGQKGDWKVRKTIANLLMTLLVPAVGSMVGSRVVSIYMDYIQSPNIRYEENEDKITFFVQDKFRNVTIGLHPQLVIRYKDYIVLSIYLEEYFDQEYLQFNNDFERAEKTCVVKKEHTDYIDKLQYLVQQELIYRVAAEVSGVSEEEVRSNLQINLIFLGGVRYESAKGNQEKRFCVIGKDGIVQDLETDDKEISDRLFEVSLLTKDNLIGMERDNEIEQILQEATDEIAKVLRGGR